MDPNQKYTPVLQKVAILSAFGNDVLTTIERLKNGETGLAPSSHFSGREKEFPVALIPEEDLLPSGHSRFYRICETLIQKLQPLPFLDEIILATTKGPIDYLEAYCENASSSDSKDLEREMAASTWLAWFNQFPELKHAKKRYINAACASSTIAIAQMAQNIQQGKIQSGLIIAVDIVCKFILRGFIALNALSLTGAKPFDQYRDGLSIGEAGVGMILTRSSMLSSSKEIYHAKIQGWGIANDATHVTAPDREASGLIRACQQALHQSRLSPQKIGSIHAHGTGTIFNDIMELKAYHYIFGDQLPWIYGIKGAIGHTLGAAGALEVVISAVAMNQGIVLPTTGLRLPEPLAMGHISRTLRIIEKKPVLSCNSGFGGINAAIILTPLENDL